VKRIGILTSGGDSPGMNATIRAVVRSAQHYDIEVYGIERGYDGLIAGDMKLLNPRDVSGTIHRGGTILKTARSIDFRTDTGFKMALNMLESFKLDGLVVVGGNGSLQGAKKLMENGVAVIGLPGTIDNDLPFSDYTIGFDTAVNTVLDAIGKVRDTSTSHDRTIIIEVMGARCGDIAIYAGITGGAEIVLVPEEPVNVSEVCKSLIENKNKGKLSSIILKAEGVDIPTQELKDLIGEKTGLDVKIVILGYLQRGGTPTARDRMLASRLGIEAVQLFAEGKSGLAVGVKNGDIKAFALDTALDMKKSKVVSLSSLNSLLL
jgi:6-phosphofructokinase 1